MTKKLIYLEDALDALAEQLYHNEEDYRTAVKAIGGLPPAQPTQTNADPTQGSALDCVRRQQAIETAVSYIEEWNGAQSKFHRNRITERFLNLPSAQPEIIRCKDCKFGEQDEVGRWYCRSLGCQIGNEDGSGFCADAERRTDGV